MSARFKDRSLEIVSGSALPGSKATRITRILLVLLSVFIVTTVVLAIVYGLEKVKTTSDTGTTTPATPASQDLCLTPYCVKAANYLIESIDQTVDPCEDFFNFVCGTWIENTRIPDDAGAENTFNALRAQLDNNVVDLLSSPPSSGTVEPTAVKNARNLYQSCIDEAGIESEGVESILGLIKTQFGGWPILEGPSWDNSTFNLMDVLLNLRKYSNSIFYRVGTSIDEKNSTNYDIEIGQGDLGLGQKQYYTTETNITVAYRQFMRDIAKSLADDVSMVDIDINDMFDFEKTISEYHWSSSEQRARDNETVRTILSNLSLTLDTTFDFTDYVIRSYLLGNITLLETDVIFVRELEYLRNVSDIVNQASSRTLQNYMIWRFVMHRVRDMPQSLRLFRDRFERIFRGTSAESPRTIQCGRYINDNMGFAVSKLYIKRFFDENARNQSFNMISNIQDAFIGMLKETTWMDSESLEKAIEKANAIDRKIGYPDYLGSDNNTKLEEDYAEYVFDKSYANNVLKLLQIKTQEDFQILRKPTDRKAWGDTAPSIVNAFYDPSKNQITFPAGILQKPFFDKDAPKYLNYGGIGVVIGHEITHGFDDEGRQFDKDGNRIPWWSDETIKKFIERKTCIVDQYSNYTITQINMTANGFQTQGEDIADNGGLRESFFAYRKWAKENPNADKRLPGLQKYTPEQMFFINYAHTWCTKMTDAYALSRLLTDVHSLGQFRAIGPTSNFDEFDRAFSCKPGQGNSRVDKCIVW
ncbi:unnamed protein product [Rotaria magnacalcarata]|uniref:Neprilysin n=1 Tax=Rotaria magnacalcarata TaxID=392030 RepID=A0A816TQA1_9BILA|nr:unnamed protein product [Rotaria magnacalcarata]CAF2214228.1 unnamed protein product [Rotaria magnacalcarata]CAF3913256.1 unnamed protein product [Rotaria magnacalcarata]CAF3998980.1 unnamed protein product [Rotaria magnacalcarata]